jgi:hypothetical protein
MKRALWKCRAVESVESQKPASPSFHEPLESSPKAGELPTFPQRRRSASIPERTGGRASPSARQGGKQDTRAKKGNSPQQADAPNSSTFSGSFRIGIACPFQAHPALESIFDFRLISGLENAEASAARHPSDGSPGRRGSRGSLGMAR